MSFFAKHNFMCVYFYEQIIQNELPVINFLLYE
jgi:hypothetical protein